MTVVILSISTTATTPPMIAAVLSASEEGEFTVSMGIMMECLSVLPVVYDVTFSCGVGKTIGIIPSSINDCDCDIIFSTTHQS